ncbi:MAG: restriction endonuclease subunit S [Bacteroidales bacterium]|nr:restriction endonuclease subunit S [Bacteroidales bacterium]
MMSDRAIQNGWVATTLGKVAVLNYGKSLTAIKRVEGKVPVYGSGGITGWHNEALVENRGLIIGRKGTVGSIHKSKIPFYPIDTVYYLTEKDTICNFDFLYYLLLNLGLHEMNSDSAVPGLNRENAYSRNITIPPLPEQKSIAAVLTFFDNKIELFRQQNQTLEEMAQTLFKEWFVDYRFLGAGKMIDSELGMIPEGWKVDNIGKYVNIKGGSTPSTKNHKLWKGEIHWTSPKDLSFSKQPFLLDTEKKITQEGLKKISSGLLPKGTLLFSSRAPIGYIAISNVDVAINQGYIAFLPDATFSNYFMFNWLTLNMKYIISAANGSTFLEISKSSFRSLQTVVPEEKILNSFDRTITPIFQKILNNLNQIQTLTKLRDTLLPKLMNGELRVKSI